VKKKEVISRVQSSKGGERRKPHDGEEDEEPGHQAELEPSLPRDTLELGEN